MIIVCSCVTNKQTQNYLNKQINNLNNWVWELVIMFHIDDDSAQLCALIGLNLLEILIRENEWERGDTSNVLRCKWKYFVYCYNCMFTLCCIRFLVALQVHLWDGLGPDIKCSELWRQTHNALPLLSVTLTIIISTESCATSGYRCYCGYRGYRAVMQHATKSADVQMQIMNFCIFHTINTFAYFQHSLFIKSSAGRLPSRARCRHSGAL